MNLGALIGAGLALCVAACGGAPVAAAPETSTGESATPRVVQVKNAPEPGSEHGSTGERSAAATSLAVQGLARGDGTAADRELETGDAALAISSFEEAARRYAAAQRLAPRDPAPLVGLARVAMSEVSLAYGASADDARGREALSLLDRALALDEAYLPARFERGRVLLALGRADDALATLTRTARELPEDAEAQSALAVARLATGDTEGALSAFERAVRLEPTSAERNANLGTAYMMRGDVERAARSYETALRIEPNNARVHGDLGAAYLAIGDLKGAQKHLTRAVALEPERATFTSNLAYARLVEGKYEQALALARRATQLDPELGSAWINLATAEARRGNLRGAREALNRALVIDPTDPRALENSAELAELEAARP